MIGDVLRATAAREPDAVAFVDGDRRLTYAEWDWLSDRAAFSLWSEGSRPGDVVALLLKPSIHYPIAYLGAAKIGCVAAGIDPRLAPPEIDHVLDASRARALVTDREDFAGEPMLFHPTDLNRPGGAPPITRMAPEDPVAIVFTSGTTGLPKAATFSARAIDAVRRIEASLDHPEDHPRGIQGIPMAHMGFMTKIASFIERAGTTMLIERWTARETLELIARERLTVVGGVPTQLALMLMHPEFGRFDLSSLRSCTIGGAPVPPDLVRRIREGFRVPVTVRYSCTELALCTGTRAGDSDEIVATTVGRPLPEVDLKIVGPNADGVGEIAARSPAMMTGYWRAPGSGIDEHGYFHTGDLGSVDGAGNLRLAGRLKEMYIRGGYNVYPVEIEEALAQHPLVGLAAVIGVPDEVMGERGLAFVVPRSPGRAPEPDDLKKFIRARLADYKVPDTIEIRGSLPMTPMLKVDKRALAEEVRRVSG